MFWPFTAGVARLALVLVAGSYVAGGGQGSLSALFWVVAASYVVFGAINAIAMAVGLSWKVHMSPAG